MSFHRSIIVLLFVLLSTASKSQYVEKDSEIQERNTSFVTEDNISVRVGFSSPQGDYGDQEVRNPNAGLANLGYNLTAEYIKSFEKVGLVFMINTNAHRMNTDDLLNAIVRVPGHPIGVYTLDAGVYRISAFMAGVNLGIPMKNGIVDVRFLLGYAISDLPYLRLTFTDTLGTQIIHQEVSRDGAMAFNIGVGFRINISQKLTFNFNIDYLDTRPSFETVTTYTYGSKEFDIVNVNMTMINSTFGIGYRIYY